MFGAKTGYVEVQNDVTGADFEKLWFESVVMVLNRIKGGYYPDVDVYLKLAEIRDALQLAQSNLNERLNSQHRTLLKAIYSTNIQIINGAIESKDLTYLDIIIASIKTILEPYNRKK